MNRRQLRIFIKVYELRNMTLAAESLFVTQPSVSQAIRELENHYNKKLFERYPKSLYPTEEGDLLYKYVKQIFDLMEQIEEEFENISGRGTLRVGANISVGTLMMHLISKEMKEAYPNVRVKVTVGGSTMLKEKLHKHEIDIAVMENIPEETLLVQEAFSKDQIVVVCAPGNPILNRKRVRFEHLKDCEFLLRNKGVGVREQFDHIMNIYGISVDPLWESNNTGALINAAKEDLGIAVLPYMLVKKELESGELERVKIEDKLLTRSLNIVYHRDKIFNEWQTAFLNIVRKYAKENM